MALLGETLGNLEVECPRCAGVGLPLEDATDVDDPTIVTGKLGQFTDAAEVLADDAVNRPAPGLEAKAKHAPTSAAAELQRNPHSHQSDANMGREIEQPKRQ